MRSAKSAFTLIELLVVVTIIVVLLALLTPALAGGQALALAADEAKTKNLLVNGDMEKVVAGKPEGWTFFRSDGKPEGMEASTQSPKEGKHCLRLHGNAEWLAAGPEDPIPLDRSMTYVLTASIRATRGQARLMVEYEKDGREIEASLTEPVEADGKWHEVSLRSEDEQYPKATHLKVGLLGSGDVDVAYDAVKFIATPKP